MFEWIDSVVGLQFDMGLIVPMQWDFYIDTTNDDAGCGGGDRNDGDRREWMSSKMKKKKKFFCRISRNDSEEKA